MPKIRFIEDRTTVEDTPQHFKAGEVYELPDASCERWVRRGVAEYLREELETTLVGDAERTFAVPGETAKPAAKTRRKA